MKCFKYRIYPTKTQETQLAQTLCVCREVYNSFLLWRIVAWETQHKSVGYPEQANALPAWKQEHPELSCVYSQVLQNVAVRVDLAFQAFFARVRRGDTPGFPRFKGAGYDSLTYPQGGYKVLQPEQAISLSKIGVVKAVLHRPVEGKIKTCTIRRQGDKWYVCFAVEVTEQPLPPSEENVGIDVGLNHFAALSTGECVDNPRFFRKDEKALAKAQRKLSTHKRGTPERRKAKRVVRRIHERISNRRHDFVHQTARRLVNRFGLLVVEKLNIQNLSRRPQPKQDEATGEFLPNGASQKAGLNKSIQDAAWNLFRHLLTRKAESAGRRVVAVNPAWTSQDCSGCATRVKKTLQERVHCCPCCGLSLDRDTNAALNILNIGMQQHTTKTGMGQHTVSGMPL